MGERGRANAWLWGLGLAVLFGLLALLAHGALAYYTVTGASFDWLEWHQRRTVDAEVTAIGMALSTFLVTVLLAGIAGSIAWSLAKRGKARASARRAHAGQPRAWSELASTLSIGFAALGAGVAATVGYLFALAEEGDALSGQDFFVVAVVTGALVAALAVFAVVIAIAQAYASGSIGREDPRGNMIGRIQLAAAHQAKVVVLVVVLLTVVAGFGITKITTDVDVADVLPRGDGNTSAAQNLTANFKSTFTQQVTVQFPINVAACERDSGESLPNRVSEMDCGNITDEVYVRALEEFYQLVLEDEENPIRFNIGLPAFYKLINWTIAGGEDADPDSFSLPGRSQEQELLYAQVEEGVWAAIPDVVTPTLDPSFEQAASLFLVSTDETVSTQEIGLAMLEFRDRYLGLVEEGSTRYTVFGPDNPPLFTVDLPIANAHASELTREDFVTLFPIIFGFIIVTLYFSFRNLAAIGIAGAALLVAAVWTFGIMGWMEIPLNTLNLTVLPLILGVGIDFSIHQITEFANHKREGLSDAEALRIAGGYAGFAMFIATLTSSSGLLVMTVSPSLLMAQLGFLSAVAIISVYLLTIVFVPALLRLARSSDDMGRRFEPSQLMLGLSRAVTRGRVVAVLLVALLTVGAVMSARTIEIEEFGEPAKNFPEDDPLRIEHERGIRGFYDLEEGGVEFKTNVIVFEGDNTDIQSHRYIEAVQQEMADKPSLNLDTSRTLPFLIRTWITVRDGVPGAGIEILRESLATGCGPRDLCLPTGGVEGTPDNYPKTREEIIETLDASFESPLATFGSLFVDHPSYNISVMTFATTTGDFEVAEEGWEDVWASIDAVEHMKPHDLNPSFVGNTALNYLFITEELPWLSYLGIVSAIVVAILSIVFTKSLRATVSITAVMLLTTIWWLGVLPLLDIGLAITLMLPAVFITSIGSDYAIHMAWNLLRNPDREEVYGVVGKAVLYSMITTVGAFAIFTQTQNVAAAKAMVATVVAILVIFLVTVLVMPVFYPLRPEEDEIGQGFESTPPLDYVPTTRVVDESPLG